MKSTLPDHDKTQQIANCVENHWPCCNLSLKWRHNGCDGVSNHQPHDWLLNRLFRRRSTKTSKLSVTGLCAGNSPVTGEFPAQMASNAENVSIWLRHHVYYYCYYYFLCSRIGVLCWYEIRNEAYIWIAIIFLCHHTHTRTRAYTRICIYIFVGHKEEKDLANTGFAHNKEYLPILPEWLVIMRCQ